MKLTGILGKGSGKLGSSVFAISGGEQIVREYNPRVSNPKTDAQVEQRAKFKLLSQLAMVFADYNTFKKDGLVSRRNQFVSANMPAVTYSNGEAKVQLDDLVISKGSRDTVTAGCEAITENSYKIIGFSVPETRPDAVLLVVAKPNDHKIIDIKVAQIVSTPDANGRFLIDNVNVEAPFVVYAVGLYFNDAANQDLYSNFVGDSNLDGDEVFATLDVVKKILANTSITTKTSTFLEVAMS